ncbi:MAG: 50S ribosomal protein L11 methyltransferase [Methylotenera sp.]|uniref:50S ribosomal protein L11 methyltransferase n=1 Tax=Methylotenera sp. TaxID=2051956 RepID=UPI00272126DA|nr:50S ribosomal protein L11 methyltransferase [Methylotenera sp.]MDO9203883.1 50S ribosomal protein L11 methyltransferase [Methylotenera sp.]MDO9393852.1 50S ribosomal protein L11 methyltransferase [Methylotenera sp.]MDP1522958.1 50S ribosomal protein L11 methyltransferase [Methylotenera sp.]MDP3307392.1 50S ribosomal protein L11 methyltransferase [Methylotenera sp.]MDP3817979.1 50S ribosomal protein L11 methyltransferase [Methylotenera sp.]
MAWVSLKIEAQDNTADLISDTLMTQGALSAIIEDANADTLDEQPIFGEPGDPPPGIWQQNLVSALFDEGIDIVKVMAALQQQTKLHNLQYTTEIIQEQDWVRATQSQFEPIKINDHLWIVPTWHSAPNADAINIVLDPGLAFGTGSHPTTHLCLAWLTQTVSAQDTVLDYGCGSGILAIAAKKLGASSVVGTDIDAQAIQSSVYNAEQNSVIAEFYHASKYQTREFDIVVANILSSALSVLAPALAKSCKSGGKIALSGILKEQASDVSAIYAEWFNMQAPQIMDSWVLLTGTKK